ncbi:glycosyltransferase family 2 protein [Halobacterium rubrum]|uniref:glycosyltransferase family 2 protein n=1 Tax=Halobacterium TaxID=2239 RepID=UPI001F21DC01|nr:MULTISPECIES: glycosyltransferase family 2 protein [Halobacterium]MDH5021414.1 glycosyltransferase family 2 protein [Halobacterium rubrum]
MKVLVTMAGRGSRFREVGVTSPKHEILVKGDPMFDWAMRSLEAFYNEEFIFVTHADHDASGFLADACSQLGIADYTEVVLDEYTNGQAQTALAADDHINDDNAVAIYNIDTYIEEGSLTPEDIDGDGFIPSFTASGERWSFIKTDDDGHATEVSEKEKISDLATAGFYYFDQWAELVDAYEHSAAQVEREYGETYVAPLYNYLIDHGKTVLPYDLDRDDVHVLGTPEDLREFDPEFTPE